MIMIPGFIIAILTFPGVIIHQLVQLIVCRILRVAVLDISFFKFKNPAGYVIHERPIESWKDLIIGIVPFLVNSVLGATIASYSALSYYIFESGNSLDIIMIWLGISLAINAFPSPENSKNMWEAIDEPGVPLILKIFTFPIAGAMFIFSIGSMLWLNLFYSILVAMSIPFILYILFL